MNSEHTDTWRASRAQRCTLTGMACNGMLSVAKIVVGMAAQSGAMVADGVHSISDFATDVVVIAMMRVSARPQNAQYRYGHGKFETLATFIIALALALVGVMLLASGAQRVWAVLQGQQLPAPGMAALWMAAASIAAKELLFRYTAHVGRRIGSTALLANAWHHRSDALSSIATLAGVAGAIFLGPRFTVLDPLAAVAVSAFIIAVAWRLGKPAVEELLEVSLPQADLDAIGAAVAAVPGVLAWHNLRCRHNGGTHVVDIHIKVDPQLTVTAAHNIATAVERAVELRLGRAITSVHIEPYEPRQQ